MQHKKELVDQINALLAYCNADTLEAIYLALSRIIYVTR